MHPSRFILPIYIRASLILVLLCVLSMGTAALIGQGTPRRVIAFVTNTGDAPQVHLMDTDRRLSRWISGNPVYSCCLYWSPDGTQIAFNGNNNRAQMVDVYSGATRRLTPSDWRGWVVGWGADGQYVVLRDLSAISGSLYRVDADGENFGMLAEGKPDRIYLSGLTPDGRSGFYAERQANTVDWFIYRLNLDDGATRLFLRENYRGSEAVAFSPDGQRVAFAPSQRREVILMDMDGGNRRRLRAEESILAMAWSPDRGRILFLAQNVAGILRVYITDADGQNPRDLGLKGRFTLMSDFSWSPDGTYIVFTAILRTQVANLYLIDADGSRLTQLTDNPAPDSYPAWQPLPG